MAGYIAVLLLISSSVVNILGQPGGGGFGQGGGPGGPFGGQGGPFGGQGGPFGGQGGPGGPFGGPGGPGGPFGGQGGPFGGPGGPFGGPGGPFGGPGGPFGGPGGPFGGGFPGGFPGGMFPNFGQNIFQAPQILTCVGYNEATDQLKITLRPEPNSVFPPQIQQRRELQRQTWRISAVYIPAASLGHISPSGTTSLVGQFFLGVTRYGRTDGSCAGLGGILQNDDTLEGSNNPFSNNPYLQALRNQQGAFGQPAGYIQDPIVISQGGNVYSGVVRDLTEVDLRGRGIAICLDYLCQRPTTTCCTIAKDSAPATEQIGPVVNTGISPNFVNTGPLSGQAIAGGASASSTAVTGGSGLIGGGNSSPGGLF